MWFTRLYTHARRFAPVEESAEEYIIINNSVYVFWCIILIHHKPEGSYCSLRKTLAQMMCSWTRELNACHVLCL